MNADAIFRSIADASPDWESWLAPDGKPCWVSPAVARVTGYSVEECMAMADYPQAMVLPEDRAAVLLFDESTDKRLAGDNLLVRLIRKDDALIWIMASWRPFMGENGEYLGVRLSIRDVSEGLHNDHFAQLRLASSRVMLDAMNAAGDMAQVYRRITECAARTLGIARVGVWLFDAPRQRLTCANLFSLADNTHVSGASIPYSSCPRYIDAISGNRRVIVSNAMNDAVTQELASTYLEPLGIASMLDVPIMDAGGTIGVLCHEHVGDIRYWGQQEITFAESMSDFLTLSLESSKRIQLEEQTRRLAEIIEATPDPVVTLTPDGTTIYINRAAYQAQAPRGDTGQTEFKITDVVAESYSPEALRFRNEVVVPAAMRDGYWNGEIRLRALTGEEIPIWQTMITHRDNDGSVKYLSSVLRDLREQKKTEEQLRAHEQLLQALNADLEKRIAERTRKVEEVNRNLEAFAYSVAHDLKAPLRGIDGYARLLKDDYRASLPGEAPLFIDNICAATGRMHLLIDDLLAFSRLGRRDLSSSHFPIHQVLRRILAERQHDIDERSVVIVDQVGDMEINTDLDCFMQSLRNLIDNAIKFTRDAVQPMVTISATRDERHIRIIVKDNGCGFNMKYHERIFAIFQRLHKAEDIPGTGIGLAIVRKAAERMGGRVWAQSEPGQGTEFFLELPA